MPEPWTSLLDRSREAITRGPRRSRAEVTALLGRIEAEVARDPAACFTLAADGSATLRAGGTTYHAGRFELASVAALTQRARAHPEAGRGAIRLSLLEGDDPAADIGALQAAAAPGTLFQAASQFNCLEAPDPGVVPVAYYPSDGTQGPRATVSAFPGTFLRHYFAPQPDGGRFVQTAKTQLELLGDAIEPPIAEVRGGYLLTDDVRDMPALLRALEERFDAIRVGLHADVEVVLGHDWGGPVPGAPQHRVAQVLTSTIALGGYSRSERAPELVGVRRQLLRAAYLGTLLGAVALDQRQVVLTLIGGGVFGNPHGEIWDALFWAVETASPLAHAPLEVAVNARTEVTEEVRRRIVAGGGDHLRLGAALWHAR